MKSTEMQTFGTSNRVNHDSTRFYNRKMYPNGNTQPLERKKVEKVCPSHAINRIYDHSSASMHEIPDNSIHLMVTSPPYNVGKEYDDNLTEKEYFEMLNAVWKEVHRVLVPGGRACINVANIGR